MASYLATARGALVSGVARAKSPDQQTHTGTQWRRVITKRLARSASNQRNVLSCSGFGKLSRPPVWRLHHHLDRAVQRYALPSKPQPQAPPNSPIHVQVRPACA